MTCVGKAAASVAGTSLPQPQEENPQLSGHQREARR
jgi:hypothetical protein